LGLGFYKLSESTLFAARIHQQTVWNWTAVRQLILDNESGLRGYPLYSFSGDNRIITNFELRTFPDFDIWIFKLGGILFYDTGTVWNQQTDMTKTQWHNSTGFGFRFQNMKSTGPTSIFRIDFAFNLDRKQFGSIIFTTDQLFSIFKRHEYSNPELYGLEFDEE
jgi:hemolysin activation/secretion protein